MSEQARFQIVEGSRSGHCCFDFTVVDSETIEHGEPKPICECHDLDDAKMIAQSLNTIVDALKEGR